MPPRKRPFADFPPLAAFRYRLGEHDPLIPLAVIGVFSGLATGLIICVFLVGIELLTSFVTGTSAAIHTSTLDALDFEGLAPMQSALGVLAACILLGIVYQSVNAQFRATGLNHTLVCVHKDHGRFPAINLLVQLIGGITALGAGVSGGREGPGIHLGAGITSVIAQRFHLPNNSLRILAACGAAGAIGASFNTPIAGVIFAMEVIVMEYTLIGFVPVILSAVTATLVSHAFFGNQSTFAVTEMELNSLLEIPFLCLVGLACGCATVVFIRIQQIASALLSLPVLFRFTLVGLVTAGLGYFLPEVMGMGYDTISQTLNSPAAWQVLLLICIAKIALTAFGSAMGMPIGIVGPSLFIGVVLGTAVGQIGASLVPEYSSTPAFYGLLAMGGVMGSLLNAPLAAVIAVMELTHNTDALLPGILVIVIANLCSTQIFGQRSANENLLRSQGILFDTHPIAQALNRLGLSAIIDRNITLLPQTLNRETLENSVQEDARTIVLEHKSVDEHGKQKLFYYSITRNQFQKFLEDSSPPHIKDSTSFLSYLKSSEISPQELLSVNVELTVEQARQLLNKGDYAGLWINDPKGPIRGVLKRDTLLKLIENW